MPERSDPVRTAGHLHRVTDEDDELAVLRSRVNELERERTGLHDFAARAAHELVAPLVMTEAYAAMIGARLTGPQHADSQRDLDALTRMAAQSRRLVEALLEDARAAHQPLEPRPVDLSEVLDDVERTMQPEIAARRARIRAGELPTVAGDPNLLHSVLLNLTVNALRYGPREGLSIDVEAVQEAHRMWCVGVTSAGTPISPEDSRRIFAPYARGQHERRLRGAGLGLAICRRIVERHGGQIGVTSLPRGNRFWFTLPAA